MPDHVSRPAARLMPAPRRSLPWVLTQEDAGYLNAIEVDRAGNLRVLRINERYFVFAVLAPEQADDVTRFSCMGEMDGHSNLTAASNEMRSLEQKGS